jgi:hypothetical protein
MRERVFSVMTTRRINNRPYNIINRPNKMMGNQDF